MLKFTSAALLTVLFSFAIANDCPPDVVTRPCTCEPAGSKTLHCEGIKDVDILKGVFKRTGKTTFRNFELANSQIESIPASSLVSKQFTSVHVFDSNLTSLFDSTPDESNVLQTVFVHKVNFQGGFPWTQLKPLKHLRFFLASEVEIPTIGSSFKENVNKNLTLIMFYDTKTKEIEDNVFSEYKRLSDIRIQKTQLKTLKRSYFPTPSRIALFFFDENEIETLPDDIFTDMPRIHSIGLKKNKISTIPEAVFGGIYNQLGYFALKGNPINCDCQTRWIASRPPKRYIDGNCVAPDKVKGKELKSLEASDFQSC